MLEKDFSKEEERSRFDDFFPFSIIILFSMIIDVLLNFACLIKNNCLS